MAIGEMYVLPTGNSARSIVTVGRHQWCPVFP